MAQDKLNTAASTETWGENDKPAPASGSTDWGAGDKEFHPEAPSRGFKGWARDVAATAVKGAIGVPEAIVGLADIPTGGRVGKFLENDGGSVGFRPKEAKELVNDWHSDATKEAQRKFQAADGIVDKTVTAIQNPSLIATAVGESLPSMGLGGVAGRGLMAATRLGQMGAKGAALAGAAGEGITAAGSAAEQIRQETTDGLLTPTQAGLAAGTGVATAGFGVLGGRVANKLGIGDAETMLAQGQKGMAKQFTDDAAAAAANPLHQQAVKGIPRRVIEGAISEGFLEELPQSLAEQIFQNVSLGKDWLQDVDSAAVMGVLSGAAMGGAASGYHGMRQPASGGAMSAPGAEPGQPAPQTPGDGQAAPGTGLDRVRQAYADQLAALQEQELGDPGVPQSTPPDGAAVLAQQQAADAARRQAAQDASRAVAEPDDEIYQSTGMLSQMAGASAAPAIRGAQSLVDVLDTDAVYQGWSNVQDGSDRSVMRDQMAYVERTYAGKVGPDNRAAAEQELAQQFKWFRAATPEQRAITMDRLSVPMHVKPSEAMGLDPAAGPLSDGAAIAVDTGVSGQMQQSAALAKAAEQAAKNGKKQADPTQKQEQPTQALQGVDQETGEVQQGAMAGWSDAQLSDAFRGAQSRDVRMQLARELSRRRAEREQQALQAELDAEQTGTVPGAERADAAFASLSEDAGPVPADLSIPTTTKGSTDGPQADQAQQARSQPPQEGATPAVARAAPDAQGIAGPQDAGAAGVANGSTTPENLGAQAAAAPGAQAAPAAETRAQRVASAGEAWTRMPTVERQALAQRTDLKPIVQKNVHRTAWESLNGDIQRKLAEAMAPAAPAADAAPQNQAPAKQAAPDYAAQVAEMLDPANPRASVTIEAGHEIPESVFRAQTSRRTDPGYTMKPGKGGVIELTSTRKKPAPAPGAPVQEKAAAPTGAVLEPVDSLHNPGKPDPKNSAAMDELDGFKPGDSVDVNGRTIGRSTVELVFRRQMAGFGMMPMARVVGADGKKLDVLLSELTRVEAAAELTLDDQLKQVNDQLANQGAVQNANTRAKRDQIRKAIAERDFPAILKAVEGDIGSAEAINQALQFAGDEPKAKVIERVLKNRGISAEYRQRWAERLMDGQVDELDAEMQSYEDRATASLRGKAVGDMLEMGNGTLYRIAGIDTAANRIRLVRNPDQLNERTVLVHQDGYNKLLADHEQTMAEAMARVPAPAPSAAPDKGPYAQWRDSTPAQRREQLSAVGYTDADQSRALSGMDWGQLTDPVRNALSGARPAAASAPPAAQNPAKASAKKKPSADQTRAKADLMNALADLGDILGKNTRMNIVPEQEQKLLPVLTRVLDAAFRLGYHKFKDSAKFALDQIREHLGADAADALTLDHLQGAYIAMAGGKQGVDTKRAVIDVETKAEIEAHVAVDPESDTDAPVVDAPDEKADTETKDAQNANPDTPAEPGEPAVAAGTGVQDGKPGKVRGNAGAVRGRNPEPAAGDAGRGPATNAGADYVPGPQGLTRTGSWFETAKRNIDLIELAIKIDAEKRPATPQEQEQLSKYVGFGASAIRNELFPVPGDYAKRQEPNRLIWPNLVRDARWKPLAERIEALPREWQQSILQSSQYAHYTSEGIIRSVWSALDRMGFKGGNVFEPGMGIGSFAMLMPNDVRAQSRYTGIEFDGPTALIAGLLSPQQNMIHGDFIKRKFPKNFFDVNVGNPPFSQTKIYGDPEYAKKGFMLHDFFFAKGIDLVRPGGIQVFVTSKGTMDKQSDKARKYLAERADLLGAIRLPSTAFEGNAGTSVVTDVIFLKKRAPGEAPGGHAWANVATVQTPDGPVVVNEYFAANPHMVLGQQRISGNVDDEGRRINSNGMGGEKYTVVSYDKTPAELDAKFAAAVKKLPAGAYAPQAQAQATAKPKAVDFDPAVKREGVIYMGKDGALMRVDEGVGKPLAGMVSLSEKEQAWFKSYVGLRDKVQAARFDQLNDGPWEKSLAALNKAYDAFRKEHGPIKDFRVQVRKSTDEDGKIIGVESRIFKNRKLYREDYDNALITSLEEITEDGDIVKAPFLKGRTIGKPVERVVHSIGDALAVSLDEIGSLNLEDVGRRLGLSREEAIEALGDQVYLTPTGEWQLADEYLSGDVVAKLEEAEEAARLQPELRRNVQALKDVQPEKLGPSQISAKLGASWVPESHVNEFAAEIGAGAVTFDPRTETWQVDGGNLRSQRTAGDEYGTAARSPSELLEAILNSRSIKVTKSVDKKTVTDEAATTAANETAKKIKDKFKGWVWTDTDRSTELVERYNKQFNNIAPRRFDGSHLTLPGVSLRFKLHPHQLRAIWRMVQTGNTYLAHAVGAGKTIEMIAGGMEQKRLGLIKKPIYVVPNHMLEQFSNEFMELYPMANIMVADDENFSPERRKAFVAAATLNNPDAIVITHDAFQRIGVKEESVAPIRDEILADLEIELAETAKSNDTRVRRSQLEQQIEAVKQRFDRIIGAGAKDSTVKFEDMGVDFVFADEAHVFRKLDFHTAQQIKGIDPNGSKRALDMYVKTRILDSRRPGRSMVFASGTPVTNTMGELYTIMRFFAGDALDKAGISTFDAWARQFGEVVPALEPNAAGKYELIERFAKFDNVPELMSRVRQFMDVLTSDNLGALVKRPDIKGGKPNLNITAPNKALQEYMKGELARRIEISKAWKPSKDEPANPDPIVAIITDGRFAALDPRFFGGKLEAGETSLLMDMGKGVVESYHATKDNVYQDKAGNDEPIKGSTQLVFYNLGFGEQSQKTRGFNSRAAFTKILTDGGIPRGEIYWFDDANTDAKKEAVFKDVRNGKVKVLIGSAKKMGTGVNVQKRLAVLHYQDPPWFPADVEQPHGRIIRQGNQNAEGAIEWYTTKGTYQSTMWQMVGRKQRFIDQAFTGDKNLRSMDDLGEASLFEQAAAVASGDPRAIQLAGLRQDVERFERLQASHASEQINVASSLRSAQWGVDSAKKRIATYTKAFAAIGERYFAFSEGKLGNATYTKPGEFGQAIKDAFNKTAADAVMAGEPVKDKPIATIGDAITIYMDEGVSEGKGDGRFELSVSFGGMNLGMGVSSGMGADVDAAGLARRIFNQINSVDQDLRKAKEDLARNEVDINKLRKKLGAPFEYQQEMAEKYAELKRLEAELKAEGQAPAKPAATAITTDDTLTPQADGESTNRLQTGAPEANDADVVFSRTPSAAPSRADSNARNAATQLLVSGLKAKWTRAPEIIVARNMQDAQIPQEVRDYDALLKSQGATGEPRGFIYKGKVYLLSDQLKGPQQIAEVLFHEVLGHYGLRGAFGDSLNSILQQMGTMRRRDVVAKAREYGLFDKDALGGLDKAAASDSQIWAAMSAKDRLSAAEEVLAEMAQTQPTIGFVQRAIAAIRNWLRANVPGFKNLKLTDNDIIQAYILPARGFVTRSKETGAQSLERAMRDAGFSRAPAGDQTQTENFKRWFAGSKVVDAEGKPLVVYHGTRGDTDFSIFKGSKFYFSPDPEYAGGYADGAMIPGFPAENSRVMPVYLSAQNPLDLRELGERQVDRADLIKRLERAGVSPDGIASIKRHTDDFPMPVWTWMHENSVRLAIQEAGFDAVFQRESNGVLAGDAFIVFRPEQVKSAIGNNGNFDPNDPDIRFSRTQLNNLKASAIDQLHQTLSHPGKVSLWDKTVGTMRHLAERSPAFKPVYEAAQRFIDDVSMLGNDAADRAPRLLPRVETLADLKKKPITAADNKAVGKPLFEGTLLWARDVDGTPVTTEALNAKYRNATPDEKAQILLRTGKIQAQMLKVWHGLPVDQFNAIINNKFESTILKPGVVWTAKELNELFGLNDQQVSLYQEARGAIDRSIDMTARADMLRMMGDEYASMRDVVLEQASMQDAMVLLTDALQADAREKPDQADRLMGLNNSVVKSYERAKELQDAGYAPLMRFGKYKVYVQGKDGESIYFGMYESQRESNLAKMALAQEFPGATITQGTMSEQEHKLLAGVTPESLEMFGNMLGLKGDGVEAQDKAFQAYLQLAKNNHSALKRLIHRKGIAGYSEDVGRVLASFVYSNARLAAGGLNAGTLETAIAAIPKEQGELRDVAMGLRSYIQDPQEEGQAVRGMLFAQYLGGSVASALVNMTQPFQITMPWLSQFGGMRKAGAHLGAALRDMARGGKYEPDLAQALHAAQEDGVVSPQEIHQLMAQARGTGSLRVGDGTRMGDARAAAANNWERVKVAWGQPFALAEQFNRRSTFIAAYRMAKEQGMPAPAEFARRAVLETQFVYSKANKPKWARGAIGGTLFTFKTYSVSYLELMQRTWNAGEPGSPERAAGRRAVGWAVAMLLLAGGAGGLPFMQDAEDLIDGAGQLIGYNISTKHWRKQFLRDTIGKELGDFLEQGVSGLPGAPIDVSGRLGMGNLLPGTGLLLAKQNRERDLLEIAGPAGDLVARGFTGARKALTGDLAGAALEVSPTAVRNAAKGLDMATSGIYKDTKGYKVIDTTVDEAIAKAIGFQPRSVAEVQESNSFMQRSKSFYIQTSNDIKAQWAQALFNKDDAALEQVRERLADWNRNNPDQPIVVKMPDVWKRVREMGKDRTQRIADTAPKALRGQMREMARENG